MPPLGDSSFIMLSSSLMSHPSHVTSPYLTRVLYPNNTLTPGRAAVRTPSRRDCPYVVQQLLSYGNSPPCRLLGFPPPISSKPWWRSGEKQKPASFFLPLASLEPQSDRSTPSKTSIPSSSIPSSFIPPSFLNSDQAKQIEETAEKVEKGELRREEALAMVDKLLEGKEREALALVEALKGRPRGLRAFGTARQVPQRSYTLEELRLNKIDTKGFLSPTDSTLSGVRRALQLSLAAGILAVWQGLGLDQGQLLGLIVGLLFLGSADQIVNGGGGEALILDTVGNFVSSKYRNRVSLHEAGHFLVSYFVGILPRSYTLSSLDAFQRYGALNVQAGTTFVDQEFQLEVQSGKLSSSTLNRFSCIALAGVATEYLRFELAEGGLSDIQQLDSLFKGLGFTQMKADSQVRWAVLNTVTLLRRHSRVHDLLVQAMTNGKSVGQCIEVIESSLTNVEDI